MPKPKKPKKGKKKRGKERSSADVQNRQHGTRVHGETSGETLSVWFSGKLVDVPKSALGSAGKTMTYGEACEFVSGQLEKGEQIYKQVANNAGPQPQPSRENVAAMFWYLKVAAEQKGKTPWMKGAFTIPDGNGNVRKFMDQCTEVYLRSSTHLKEQQVGDGIARGIDFYEGNKDAALLLPFGLNTLLYQAVTPGSGEQRLYFKPEGEGARISTLDRSKVPDNAPRERPTRFLSDLANAAIHGKEAAKAEGLKKAPFLKWLGIKLEDGGLPTFREQVPKDIANSYAGLLKAAQKERDKAKDPVTRAKWDRAVATLKTGHMGGSAGDAIRVYQIAQNLNDLDTASLGGDWQAAVTILQQQLGDTFKEGSLDDRFGGEIVVTASDLAAPLDFPI